MYVTEIMIAGTVKDTPFDQGNRPTIEGSTVADEYWSSIRLRKVLLTTIK